MNYDEQELDRKIEINKCLHTQVNKQWKNECQ